VKIRQAANTDEASWNEYIQTHNASSPYHLFAWKRAVESAYGHKAYYLIAEESNRITGVLPLIHLKMPLLSGVLVALPYCDVGDVLAEDRETGEKLIMEAVSLAQILKTKYIELRGQSQLSPFQDLNLPLTTQLHKVRMLLDLPRSAQELWDGFKSKLRSQIRKAEKNGLQFQWANLDDVDIFYDVFSRNMRDLGSPVHSRKWFYYVFKYFGENARTGMVYKDNVLIGAGVILNTTKSICIPWASTLRAYNRFSPNMMLYWNFLKHAADNGYARFDFGRSTPDESTYKFKAQWGAEPEPLYWHYLTSNHEMNFDAGPSITKEKIAQIWRKIPAPLANCLGPAIRKYISL